MAREDTSTMLPWGVIGLRRGAIRGPRRRAGHTRRSPPAPGGDRHLRRRRRGGTGGVNTILNTVHAPGFFTDAAIPVFPISWQDTGSGVFTLALAVLVLGLGPLATAPGRRVALTALLAAMGALPVDIYLY